MSALIPAHASAYRTKEYWDWRYATEGPDATYEWFVCCARLRPCLAAHLHAESRILVIGCGNSGLSEDLYADGYRSIHNIDYSETVIRAMRLRTQDTCPGMQWSVMDMRHMQEFADGSFDVVLDKGALDAVWSDGGSQWEPSEQVQKDVAATVGQVSRVLREGGRFVVLSFGQPHFRRQWLERPCWRVECAPLDFCHIYTMVKERDC